MQLNWIYLSKAWLNYSDILGKHDFLLTYLNKQ